jgi:hypothetical protein
MVFLLENHLVFPRFLCCRCCFGFYRLAAQEKGENNLTNRLCRKEEDMPNCLGLDLLSKDDPSEWVIMAKRLFLIVLGLVVLGYLGYSFGELFPVISEMKVIGCIVAIIFGVAIWRFEKSVPRTVNVKCDFCEEWGDIDGSKPYSPLRKVACDACDQHPDLLYFVKF